MKKLFTAVLIALGLATTSFADPITKVDLKTLVSFESIFMGAERTEWTQQEDYTKASFILQGQELEAYFDLRGDFMGCSKPVSRKDLPIAARREINKKYDDYLVKEILQFSGADNNVLYFMSLENDKEEVVLEITPAGDIKVAKTTRK